MYKLSLYIYLVAGFCYINNLYAINIQPGTHILDCGGPNDYGEVFSDVFFKISYLLLGIILIFKLGRCILSLIKSSNRKIIYDKIINISKWGIFLFIILFIFKQIARFITLKYFISY